MHRRYRAGDRMSPMKTRILFLVVLAQLARPNTSGVMMGHLHYQVRDVEANRKFWMSLGGKPTRMGAAEVLKFPDVFVFLDRGEPSAVTEGSVVNHVAFRVQSLKKIEAAGLKVQYNDQFIGVAY